MHKLNPELIRDVNLKFVPVIAAAMHAQHMVEHAGTRLKRSLQHLGQTQAWLAEQLGVSNNAVSKWIRTGEISRENVVRASEKIGVSVAEILTGSDEMGLRPDAQALLDAWNELPEEARKELGTFTEFLKVKYRKKDDAGPSA